MVVADGSARDPGSIGDVGNPGDTSAGKDAGVPADKGQVDQIVEMLDAFVGPEKKEEKPIDGKDDKDKKEESGEKDELDKSKKDKEDKEDKKEDKEEPDKVTALEAKIAELTEKMTALSSEKKPGEEKPVENEETSLKEQLEEINKDLVGEYIKDDAEYDTIVESREKMNTLLKTVQTDTLQGVLRSIPKVLGSIVSKQIFLYNKTADFYRANSDLKEHGKLVGSIIDETAEKNPSWDLDKVLEYVGGKTGEDGKVVDDGEVRRRLKLKKKAQDNAAKENSQQRNVYRDPAARTAHVRQPSDTIKLTGIEKEISDMLNATQT